MRAYTGLFSFFVLSGFFLFLSLLLLTICFPRLENPRVFVRTAVDDFYEQCDPDKENLCLYGNPDGTWEVQLPAEEVPPELPEPALGINFARDGMQVRALLFFFFNKYARKKKQKQKRLLFSS